MLSNYVMSGSQKLLVLLGIVLLIVVGLMASVTLVNAQTVNGVPIAQSTSTDSTSGTGTTDDTIGTTTTDSTTAAPGAPNTGLGGNAAINIALLIVSTIAGIGGASYLYRLRTSALR